MAKLTNEIAVIMHAWGDGDAKPCLRISFDALARILDNESAVISPDDVSRLMGAFHTYAAQAEGSKRESLDAWEAQVEIMEALESEEVEEAGE